MRTIINRVDPTPEPTPAPTPTPTESAAPAPTPTPTAVATPTPCPPPVVKTTCRSYDFQWSGIRKLTENIKKRFT